MTDAIDKLTRCTSTQTHLLAALPMIFQVKEQKKTPTKCVGVFLLKPI